MMVQMQDKEDGTRNIPYQWRGRRNIEKRRRVGTKDEEGPGQRNEDGV
jgi:hypothetical protein